MPVPKVTEDYPTSAPTAYYSTSWISSLFSGQQSYNPDQLLQRKGYDIYARMETDEQVQAVLKFKRDAILARQWDLVFEGDSKLSADEQKARVDLAKKWLGKTKGSFTDNLAQVMRAQRDGFSITEKMSALQEIDGKTWIVWDEVRPKPAETFYFNCDRFGALTEFGQRAIGLNTSLDLADFIHFVVNPDQDVFYGRSELRSAYRPWYLKDVVLKMQALWLERMAGGFVTAEIDVAATLQPADLAALNNALKNVKTISGIIPPPGVKLGVVQAQGDGAAFNNALEYYDLAIAKALLVPNLLGVSSTGQKTGSYSQSQTQLEAFFWTLNADSNRLESVVQEQYFLPLFVANWGDDQYPCFRLKRASEDFVKWVVGQWVSLVSANAAVTTENDEAHLRSILNMPPRGKDDKPLVKPPEQMQQGQPQANADTPGGGAREPVIGAGDSSSADYSRTVAHTKTGKPISCTPEAFSRAAARVNFSVIEDRTQSIASDASASLSKTMAQMVNKALTDLPGMLNDPDTVEDLRFADSQMRQLQKGCVNALDRAWDLGSRQANAEVNEARAKMARRAGKAAPRIFRALRGDDATGFLKSNGYRMAGNLANGADSIIQQELLRAIKAGDRPEEAAASIYSRLIDKGYTDLSAVNDSIDDEDVKSLLQTALGTASEGGTLAYLNTLTRTNIFESLNEARFSAFKDPDLQGFVEALEYSAVLDERTSEICQALDGYTADSDADSWDKYRPPNHFNCRSVLIPVTAVDGWNGEDDPDPSVEPASGFGDGEK